MRLLIKRITSISKRRVTQIIAILLLVIVLMYSGILLVKAKTKMGRIGKLYSEVVRLNNNTLEANLYIRQAAVAPSLAIAISELDKTYRTRTDSTNIYTDLCLSYNDILSDEDKAVVAMMMMDRVEYRKLQFELVGYIKSNADKALIWKSLTEYDKYLDRYQYRLQGLLSSIGLKFTELNFWILKIVVISLSFSTAYMVINVIRLLKHRNSF